MRLEKDILISGNWISSSDTCIKVSPVTGETSYEFSDTSPNLVEKAVESAGNAFFDWKKAELTERLRIIKNFRDSVSKKKDLIISTIIEDTGKPFPEAETEVIEILDIIDFYLSCNFEELKKCEIKINNEIWPHKKVFQYRESKGVYAVIKPWNYPFELPLWSIIPILIPGNTIVFKPSELSTKTGVLIGSIFLESGLPNGVLNIVTGGQESGKNLVSNPKVNAISFTGSISTGKKITRRLNESLAHLSLELGGNDVAIVLDDTDINKACTGIVWGAFTNAGQVCVSIERLLISREIYDEVKDRLIILTKNLKFNRDIGPLISQNALEKVVLHVKNAVEKGGTVLVGGKVPSQSGFNQGGFYFEPTIIESCSNDILAWNEETFGPLIIIRPFDTIDELTSLANNSNYALGASIWTKDTKIGNVLASKLNCGMVWINDVNLPLPEAPWLGIKDSGIGLNLSKEAVYDATNKKILHIDYDEQGRIWWFPYK